MSDMYIIVKVWSTLAAIGVSGILILAVYKGPWTFALVFLFPAVNIGLNLVQNVLYVFSSGESFVLFFYVLLVLQSLYVVSLFGMTAWLAIPAQNREFTKVLNDIAKEYSGRGKAMNKTTQDRHI